MSSVGDDLREERRAWVAGMSAADRIALTATLAEWDLSLFCAARGVSREEGRHILARVRQQGRLRSRVALEAER